MDVDRCSRGHRVIAVGDARVCLTCDSTVKRLIPRYVPRDKNRGPHVEWIERTYRIPGAWLLPSDADAKKEPKNRKGIKGPGQGFDVECSACIRSTLCKRHPDYVRYRNGRDYGPCCRARNATHHGTGRGEYNILSGGCDKHRRRMAPTATWIADGDLGYGHGEPVHDSAFTELGALNRIRAWGPPGNVPDRSWSPESRQEPRARVKANEAVLRASWRVFTVDGTELAPRFRRRRDALRWARKNLPGELVTVAQISPGPPCDGIANGKADARRPRTSRRESWRSRTHGVDKSVLTFDPMNGWSVEGDTLTDAEREDLRTLVMDARITPSG